MRITVLYHMYIIIIIFVLHRAVLYVTHGVGEYGGRYESLGVYLRDNSIAVHTQDFG